MPANGPRWQNRLQIHTQTLLFALRGIDSPHEHTHEDYAIHVTFVPATYFRRAGRILQKGILQTGPSRRRAVRVCVPLGPADDRYLHRRLRWVLWCQPGWIWKI